MASLTNSILNMKAKSYNELILKLILQIQNNKIFSFTLNKYFDFFRQNANNII